VSRTDIIAVAVFFGLACLGVGVKMLLPRLMARRWERRHPRR
jgi:hypothetical protein